VVLEGQSPNHSASLRVGIGSAIALPVIQYHQSIRTCWQVLCTLIQQVIEADALRTCFWNESSTEILSKPFDDRTSGDLTTFYYILTRNYSVGEGAKEPRTMDSFCGLAENSMRRTCDKSNFARSQHTHA